MQQDPHLSQIATIAINPLVCRDYLPGAAKPAMYIAQP
ncbi:hypothetical protein SAMN05880566_1389 [Janthinobacterium sp. TND4EL3]|nr:hypothetical protein SAMN05880566_1389 [Janthinobacterium sp. TND4EL3]